MVGGCGGGKKNIPDERKKTLCPKEHMKQFRKFQSTSRSGKPIRRKGKGVVSRGDFKKLSAKGPVTRKEEASVGLKRKGAICGASTMEKGEIFSGVLLPTHLKKKGS